MIVKCGLDQIIERFEINNYDSNILACYDLHPHGKGYNIVILEVCSIILITQGETSIRYNNYEVHLTKDCLFIYYPGIIYYFIDESDDLDMRVITINTKFLTDILKKSHFYRDFWLDSLIVLRYGLKLQPTQQQTIYAIMTQLKDTISNNKSFKIQRYELLIMNFFLELAEILQHGKMFNEFKFSSLKKNIFIHFMDLAKKNFIQHRDIEFYANQLGISTIYLSRVVKKTTNSTVLKILEELVLIEACIELTSKSKTISEIASFLNFADQASFSRFFKKKFHKTPSQYRNDI